MPEHIESFLSAWTRAECAGDTGKLEGLLAGDFYGVGPLGFILPRPAWLARHGELVYEAFDLDEIQTREHGGVVIVTARNNTRGSYRGNPVPEAARATLVIVADSGSWQLAAIHMSFMAGTRGSPPIPGAGHLREGPAGRPGAS
jgi:Domain of unknown function (DUF4440)